jgi:hypothetical protein
MSGAALRTTVVLSGAGGQWVQIWVRSEWFFHAGFRSGSGRDGKHLIGSDGWKLVFDMAQGWVMGVGLCWRWWGCVFDPVVVFVKVEVVRICSVLSVCMLHLCFFYLFWFCCG